MNHHEELARLEALDAKRTQGEWRYEYRMRKDGMYAGEVFDSASECIATMAWHRVPTENGYRTDREENGNFIANAPAMMSCLRAFAAENKAQRERMEKLADGAKGYMTGSVTGKELRDILALALADQQMRGK